MKYPDDLLARVLGGNHAANPQQHTDPATVAESFRRHAKPLAALDETPALLAQAREIVRSRGRANDEIRWVPISGLSGSGIMLIDAESADPVQLITATHEALRNY
ncbi:hypothetical protein GCM10028795_24070 [Lysobacter olei]